MWRENTFKLFDNEYNMFLMVSRLYIMVYLDLLKCFEKFLVGQGWCPAGIWETSHVSGKRDCCT